MMGFQKSILNHLNVGFDKTLVPGAKRDNYFKRNHSLKEN